MAEYSANAIQTINPGEDVTFTTTVEPCRTGLVRHRDGSGNFLLSGMSQRRCCRRNASYSVDFGANIAVPTGETVGPISVAYTIDGSTVPATAMIVTPDAVEEYFNVSRSTNLDIWRGCCETVTVRNTSSIPILVQNANIVIERTDLALY